MNSVKSILLAIGIALSLSPAVCASAEEPTKKKLILLRGASAMMLANTCTGCHGSNGVSSGPAIPTIAGLSLDYLINRMDDFKTDKTPATVMKRVAKGYSNAEIRLIAEYFSRKIFVAAQHQNSDTSLASKGKKLHYQYCEKCHSGGGALAEDNAGVLAGQWKLYLLSSLEDFISEERKAPKKMTRRLRKLIENEGMEGIQALVEFYAQ